MIKPSSITKYLFMLIIILLSLFIDVNLAIDNRLDSPNNINNFHLVVDFSMTMIVLGLIGCVYVFYRVYKQWILSKKKLAMIYRLPFYTACTGKVYQTIMSYVEISKPNCHFCACKCNNTRVRESAKYHGITNL
jgi:hypothetical protein